MTCFRVRCVRSRRGRMENSPDNRVGALFDLRRTVVGRKSLFNATVTYSRDKFAARQLVEFISIIDHQPRQRIRANDDSAVRSNLEPVVDVYDGREIYSKIWNTLFRNGTRRVRRQFVIVHLNNFYYSSRSRRICPRHHTPSPEWNPVILIPQLECFSERFRHFDPAIPFPSSHTSA